MHKSLKEQHNITYGLLLIFMNHCHFVYSKFLYKGICKLWKQKWDTNYDEFDTC